MIYFIPVKNGHNTKIVQSFPSNKAPGWDKITTAVIKDALPFILPVLVYRDGQQLFSHFCISLILEKVWGCPNLEKGDHEVPNNNRPTSLLRVALDQLNEYLVNKKCLTDTILEAVDRKQVTALVLLDLSKAFDNLDHILLMEKLRSVDLSEATLD